MQEKWKPVPGYEGLYEVSSQGRVRSPRGMRSLFVAYGGYVGVTLFRENKPKNWHVHQLVAGAFIGPATGGHEVNHKNLNRSDNRPSNLEYVTASQNMRHALEWGMSQGVNTLLPKDVRNIRRALRRGATQKSLAAKYGVSRTTIGAISQGRTWAWLK